MQNDYDVENDFMQHNTNEGSSLNVNQRLDRA
jgi:hypothetical protein